MAIAAHRESTSQAVHPIAKGAAQPVIVVVVREVSQSDKREGK